MGVVHLDGNGVYHLHPVTDTYRQNEKGHQDGVSVEAKAE